jgi:hypothetical protein
VTSDTERGDASSTVPYALRGIVLGDAAAVEKARLVITATVCDGTLSDSSPAS